ncbi:MAG: GLPGLI family protein [Bacteroidaceae bacterium]|nr:GLPGLI family protein [Bacteroidaceae bacterium]
MQKVFYLFISVVFSLPLYAQYGTFPMTFPTLPDTHFLEATYRDTLDFSFMRVLYKRRTMPDTLARDNFSTPRTYALHIAKSGKSLFSKLDAFVLDSAYASREVNGKIMIKEAKAAWESVPGKDSNTSEIWKNHPEKRQITYLNRTFMDSWVYTQDFPDFQWEILPDSTQTILEHPCMMAVGNYAGRTWKVWFTVEIPVSDGPWKLCGLPGLILKAEDKRGEFFYTAIGIQQITAPMPTNFKEPLKTTRERYLKIQEDYTVNGVNQISASGVVTNMNRTQSAMNIRPYNPMEFY